MRIRVRDAGATRLEIDLSDGPGPPSRLVLGQLRGVTGHVENGAGVTRVRPMRAASAVVAELEWPLPAGGRLLVTSPAVVTDLVLELDVAAAPDSRSPSGRAAAARFAASGMTVELGDGWRVAFDAAVDGVAVAQSPERAGHAAGDRVQLGDLQAALAGTLVRASSAALEQIRVDWHAGEVLLGAASASLRGLSLQSGGILIEAEHAELPEGLRTSGGALVIPELVIPDARVTIDDVVALFRAGADPQPASDPLAEPDLDLRYLDRLDGRLDVDLTMDLSVPVLGRREATHRFRVPIVTGVINYRDLEHDLANVEDAFIDVEVRGKKLVVERAIPLLPGPGKPLIVWHLDADELELARRRLVRLRTIPRLRLVERAEPSSRPSTGSPVAKRSSRTPAGERSGVAVRRLDFDAIDVSLSLAAADDDESFDESDPLGRARAGELRVTGRVTHRAGEVTPATELSLSARDVGAGPLTLPLGGGRLEIDSIEATSIGEGTIAFEGLRPGGAGFVIRGLVARNLRLVLALAAALAAGSLTACADDDQAGTGVPPPDARERIDAGPTGDAHIGIVCMGRPCTPEQLCCGEIVEPPILVYACIADEAASGCENIFDCDGPEDCESGLCCGGTIIACAPPGATSCTGGAVVCHVDDDCRGSTRCCPTPTGVVG